MGTIALIFVICLIGGVYGINYYYTSQQYDENFKKQYYYYKQYNSSINEAFILDNKTASSEEDFENIKKNTLARIDDAINYENQTIFYEENMVKFAPSDDYRNYSGSLLKMNKEILKSLLIWRQMVELKTYKGFSDANKYNNLDAQFNQSYTNAYKLSKEKEKVKFENPELDERVNALAEQT